MSTDQEIKPLPRIWVHAPGHQYVMPYFERELSDNYVVVTDVDRQAVDAAVMVSSTDIYGLDKGLDIDEMTPIDAESPFNHLERVFIERCRTEGLCPVILRCAPIVATGMTGKVMTLTKALYRGIARHLIPACDTVMSVVHAVDLPVIARMLAECHRADSKPRIYNVTDGTQTNIDDLIEALAHRLDDKRIGALKRRWARWLMGRRLYHMITNSLTFDDTKLRRTIDYKPTVVTDYLLTHVYDHESL